MPTLPEPPMGSDLMRIEDKAHRMRSAIESVPRRDLPLTMRNFPSGACGDAALLVGGTSQIAGSKISSTSPGNEAPFTRIPGPRTPGRPESLLPSTLRPINSGMFPEPIIVPYPSRRHRRRQIEDEPMQSDSRDWNRHGMEELHHLYARICPDLFSRRFRKGTIPCA